MIKDTTSSSSPSEERTVTEDTDGVESTTITHGAFISMRCVGTMAGAATDRAVLVSSVPLGAFAGGRGGL